jgi:hypothetical protein
MRPQPATLGKRRKQRSGSRVRRVRKTGTTKGGPSRLDRLRSSGRGCRGLRTGHHSNRTLARARRRGRFPASTCAWRIRARASVRNCHRGADHGSWPRPVSTVGRAPPGSRPDSVKWALAEPSVEGVHRAHDAQRLAVLAARRMTAERDQASAVDGDLNVYRALLEQNWHLPTPAGPTPG